MDDLLELYEEMRKEAAENEKVAEEQTPEKDERKEVLSKYAELAENMLKEEYKDDYSNEDVVKLAQMLIDHDAEVEIAMDKVAEAHQLGVIQARSFAEELQRLYTEKENK